MVQRRVFLKTGEELALSQLDFFEVNHFYI